MEPLPDYFSSHLNRDMISYAAAKGTLAAIVLLLITHMPATSSVITGKFRTILNVYTCPELRRQEISETLLTMAINDR